MNGLLQWSAINAVFLRHSNKVYNNYFSLTFYNNKTNSSIHFTDVPQTSNRAPWRAKAKTSISPVKPAALEVDRGEQQQDACIIRLLPPQLHAVTLSRLKISWLIFTMRQFCQTLEGKHTFGWFWSTNATQRKGGNNMLEEMEMRQNK